jgi:hypothetical protein
MIEVQEGSSVEAHRLIDAEKLYYGSLFKQDKQTRKTLVVELWKKSLSPCHRLRTAFLQESKEEIGESRSFGVLADECV